MVKRMKKFIGLVREKIGAPKDFSDKKYLTDLMSILQEVFKRERAAMAGLFRGPIFLSLIAFEFYRERLTDRGRIREFEEVAREELHNLLDELLEVSVQEIGSLSAGAGPREQAADKPA